MHYFLKFIVEMKLYMFRTVPLSIIMSFSLYTQQWYISYRFADSLRAGLGLSSPAQIVGSNPTGGIDECCVFSVVRWRSLRRADHSSRGVLPSAVRCCVWSRNLVNEGAWPTEGGVCGAKKTHVLNNNNEFAAFSWQQWLRERVTALRYA